MRKINAPFVNELSPDEHIGHTCPKMCKNGHFGLFHERMGQFPVSSRNRLTWLAYFGTHCQNLVGYEKLYRRDSFYSMRPFRLLFLFFFSGKWFVQNPQSCQILALLTLPSLSICHRRHLARDGSVWGRESWFATLHPKIYCKSACVPSLVNDLALPLFSHAIFLLLFVISDVTLISLYRWTW